MTQANTRLSRRHLAFALIGLFVAACASTVVLADPAGPNAEDRQVAVAVVELLRRDHLSGHPMDDEISERCLELYLKSLDPWKLYFYQSDVDVFKRREHDLAESVGLTAGVAATTYVVIVVVALVAVSAVIG